MQGGNTRDPAYRGSHRMDVIASAILAAFLHDRRCRRHLERVADNTWRDWRVPGDKKAGLQARRRRMFLLRQSTSLTLLGAVRGAARIFVRAAVPTRYPIGPPSVRPRALRLTMSTSLHAYCRTICQSLGAILR